eukprot:1389650-Rhodomonas_salina.2
MAEHARQQLATQSSHLQHDLLNPSQLHVLHLLPCRVRVAFQDLAPLEEDKEQQVHDRDVAEIEVVGPRANRLATATRCISPGHSKPPAGDATWIRTVLLLRLSHSWYFMSWYRSSTRTKKSRSLVTSFVRST